MFTPKLISKFNKMDTPFYYYDMEILQVNLDNLKKTSREFGYQVHYAMKANANGPILKRISEFGFGADCVSGNEVQRALDFNFPADKIVLAGVGKTDKEIMLALQNNILCLNCESLQELQVINNLAGKTRKVVPVALRINPDLEANTHHYITTGTRDNKFGINFQDLENIAMLMEKLDHIKLLGLHTHIGSQISDLDVFKKLALRLNEIQAWFSGQGFEFSHLNVGGGLAVDYHDPDQNLLPDYRSYFEVFHDNLEPVPEQTIHFELGRAVVGQCGALISRVLYTKSGLNTKFAIVDAGMTELIRPALYNAYHKIENLTSSGPPETCDVVGPVCESSDFLGKGVVLPATRRGDLLAIRTTGAYAEVMASHYNLRNTAPAVYSDDL
jgi:diaminopimelate decarboxylase